MILSSNVSQFHKHALKLWPHSESDRIFRSARASLLAISFLETACAAVFSSLSDLYSKNCMGDIILLPTSVHFLRRSFFTSGAFFSKGLIFTPHNYLGATHHGRLTLHIS